MDTVSCLLCYPWRTLMALAAVYGAPIHHRRPKEKAALRVSAAIHACLGETLSTLGPEAQAALRALAQADNLAISRSNFIARFGSLQPYRPWNHNAPPAPWPTPQSPAATLVHYGLAYPLDLGADQRPLPIILLPHDLRAALAARLNLSITLPPPPAGLQTCNSPRLLADLFTFLSFLNRQDYGVRDGRWLSPRALKSLNDHLSPPDALGAGRSELQAARIPFIHYLAERAGLIGLIGGCLKPTLIAEEWLTAPLPRRLRALWDVWRECSDENRALWRRYRLPAIEEDDDPAARFQMLLGALGHVQDGHVQDVPLLDALIKWEPALLRSQSSYAAWVALDPQEQADLKTRARAVLLNLLTGPLTWFGVLEWANGRMANGRMGESAPLLLTPLGAALLGRDDGAWPTDPAPAALRVAPLLERTDRGTTVIIDAPAGLPLRDRLALEAIVPPDPAAPGRYSLARLDLLHALQRGRTVEGAVNFLERASGEPLPAPVLGTFYRWAEELDRVTVRQTILLQTNAPGLLRDLTSQRRVRETLGKTLNARTVEVRADRLDALLRRLAHRDIVPRIDLGSPSPTGREKPALSTAGEGEGERAVIAAALRIYAHLADELGLPTRPAYALAQRWSEGLPIPLRDAARSRVKDTLEALHRAAPVEMEDCLPEPTGPLLDVLEAAIEKKDAVEIEYYTAGRAHHTTRRVEPLRLEWRGDVIYLIAHCHLRGDQRVFRVDRIERIGE